MRVLKDDGMKAGDWLSIDTLNSKIEVAAGIDKRTKEQYARALCSFKFLRVGENFNFQILTFPGDADGTILIERDEKLGGGDNE